MRVSCPDACTRIKCLGCQPAWPVVSVAVSVICVWKRVAEEHLGGVAVVVALWPVGLSVVTAHGSR
jgi:hypothetical protein